MLLLFFACQSPPAETPAAGPPVADAVETISGEEGQTPAEVGVPVTPAVALFDETVVHAVEITLDDAGIRSLNRDGKTYVEASLTMDGAEVGAVGLRLKGSSSWRDLNQKAGMKIDVNYFYDGTSYDGYTKINLNNMLNDEAQLHEMLAWSVFEAAGLPAQHCAYAWVRVNGEDYGLYLLLELPDQEAWLDRTYGGHDGRVYEGGYPYYPESWDHADFSVREAGYFQLEAGEDVANSDVMADRKSVV